MFDDKKALIVVYKDELVLNQLKKYVETNDDEKDGTIVGTKDGTVSIIPWNEKYWAKQKEAGIIGSKILLIGDVNGADKLSPVIDIKYNQYGIKYGWAGNQALLQVNSKVLLNRKLYDQFLSEFRKEMLPEKEKGNVVKTIAKKGGITLLFGLIGLGISFAVDFFSDQNKVKQQQLLFGVSKLYKNDLADFINE